MFGESAGSVSIFYHLLSEKSRGLFQRAIMQSGTALGLTWGKYISPEKALQYSSVFASNLDCGEADLMCLQSKSVTDIIEQTDVLEVPDDMYSLATAWMPVVDEGFTSGARVF